MTVLILGITGQDGAYLAKHLLGQGRTVHGTSRGLNPPTNLKRLQIFDTITMHICDFSSQNKVYEVIDFVKPTEIYNLGGQTSVGASFNDPIETYNSNTIATLYILEAIRRINLKIKFYNAGSSEIFGNTTNAGANEQTSFRPMSPYAVSKVNSIALVKMYREVHGIFALNGILFNHESNLRNVNFVTQKIITSGALIKAGKITSVL